MGADAKAVEALRHDSNVLFPRDAQWLHNKIKEDNLVLIIIDPLFAHIERDHNTWNDQQVRHALAPLTEAAQDTGAAIVAVRHLHKKPGMSALQRGGGSIGIIGVARVGYRIGSPPKDPRLRVPASVKYQLGPTPASFVCAPETAG